MQSGRNKFAPMLETKGNSPNFGAVKLRQYHEERICKR